jgi:hypothetical protein
MKVPEATKTTLRVLLIQHSLSGETNTATHEFLRGMKDGIEHDDCWPNNRRFELVEQRIETAPSFAFPWNVWSFFDVMAETVAPSVRIKSKHWTVKEPNVVVSRADDDDGLVLVDEPSSSSASTDQRQPSPGDFDLVVLGWQTWFLSPSLPVRLAVHHAGYQTLLQTAPVLLIGTHRNMWHRASRTLCQELTQNARAKLVGPGINFVQSSAFLVSVVKTLRWQLKGEMIDSNGGGATNAKDQAYTVGYNFARQYNGANGGDQSSAWPTNYQGGKPYSTTLAFLEDLWFPLKRAAALVMGLFPPGSVYRKIVTVLYVPLLLSAIVLLAPPVLFVGGILNAKKNKQQPEGSLLHHHAAVSKVVANDTTEKRTS